MRGIGKKVVVWSLVGMLQIGFGASVIEASPFQNVAPPAQQYGRHDQDRERHERERLERERHEQERRENERHEREMKRRPHESRKEWHERQHREMERHRRALEDIRTGRYMHPGFGRP